MASKIWITIVFTVVVAIVGIYSECPAPDCTSIDPGRQTADPEDCHRFYICLGGGDVSDVSFPCDDGQYFEPDNGTCVEEIKPCTNNCSGGGECQLSCGNNLLFINNANNCTQYYICLPGGQTIPGSCPVDLPYFDSSTGNCTTDETLCCEACTPQCTDSGVQVPDPYDCFKFYACQAPGIPDENLHGTCPEGKVFNADTGFCEEGDTCTPLCEGGDNNSTGSTPGGSTDDLTSPILDSTTPGTTLDPNGCSDSYICTAVGNFPKCTTCQSEFFYCRSDNGDAEVKSCPGNLVFNPESLYCILPEDCPV